MTLYLQGVIAMYNKRDIFKMRIQKIVIACCVNPHGPATKAADTMRLPWEA